MDSRQTLFARSPRSDAGYDVNTDLKKKALDVLRALDARYTSWRSTTVETDATGMMDDTHVLVREYIQAMLGIDPTQQ